MEAITPALIAVGAVNLLLFPLLLWYIKRHLERFDRKRDEARAEQAEDKKQREAERSMLLAIARTMLLDNYEKCMEKGCYTLDEREVYALLYASYKEDKGNGVIDAIAKKIRELPTEPPAAA